MKNTITLLFICLSSVLFSQSTLTIFNNGGQQFYVILNGIKQNSVPQTNVSISGIKNGSYSVKLIFADGKTRDIDKNFFLEESSYVTTRVVFKKGKGKLQLIGMEPMGAQKPADNQVVYRPSDTSVYSDAPVISNGNVNTQQSTTTFQTNTNVGQQQMNTQVGTNVNGNQGGVNTNVQVTETQTTTIGNNSGQQQINTQIGTNVNGNQSGMNTNVQVTETQTTQTTTIGGNAGQGENVNINMNINVQDPTMNGQGGANISINMSGTGLGNQTQQETFQQTTTVTTSGTQTNTQIGSNQQQTMNNQVQTNVQTNATNNVSNNSNSTSTSGMITCKNILGNEKAIIDDLKSMTFEEDKKETAMKDLANHCLTASQAYKIIEVFTFEADRLELAMYFYNRMIDKDSAKNLLPLFTFDATKMEFREFIRNN